MGRPSTSTTLPVRSIPGAPPQREQLARVTRASARETSRRLGGERIRGSPCARIGRDRIRAYGGFGLQGASPSLDQNEREREQPVRPSAPGTRGLGVGLAGGRRLGPVRGRGDLVRGLRPSVARFVADVRCLFTAVSPDREGQPFTTVSCDARLSQAAAGRVGESARRPGSEVAPENAARSFPQSFMRLAAPVERGQHGRVRRGARRGSSSLFP